MTAAKLAHKAARLLILRHLPVDPLSVGLVGDARHSEGGDSYHLGKDQIRTSGHRYSVDESGRDKRGLDNYASALDLGQFKVKTGKGTFDLYDYNAWLIGLCKTGDPDTVDLREVIYSPDGKVVRRWDREGRRGSGDDSHLSHTHHSEYRDADGRRMVRIATRWLQHIGLLAGGDDDVSQEDVFKALESPRGRKAIAAIFNVDGMIAAPGEPKPGKNPDGSPVNTHWAAASYLRNTYNAAVSARTYAAEAKTALAALAKQSDPAKLAAVLAPLLTGSLPQGPVDQAALEAALRNVLGSLDSA